ncbi:MAG: CAP domain-containing protein [Pricia sp.]
MKMRKHYVVAVFMSVLGSCSKESVAPLDVAEKKNIAEVEQQLLKTVNEHRVSKGLNVLEFNSVAYEHANAHTDYMIALGAINHDNFKVRASEISARTDAEFVAENVAKDYTTASEAFQGWLNSTNHKRTMEGDFTHTAVSVKKDADGNRYYTQIFFR